MSVDVREAVQETPFWRFSLVFYEQPDVANACLALQDELARLKCNWEE
jgi:hypothetical protein